MEMKPAMSKEGTREVHGGDKQREQQCPHYTDGSDGDRGSHGKQHAAEEHRHDQETKHAIVAEGLSPLRDRRDEDRRAENGQSKDGGRCVVPFSVQAIRR